MVGNTSPSTEKALGRLLAPYLADSSNAFVISSDFAHWGTRFRYTYYRPSSGAAVDLSSSAKPPKDPAIHESIKQVDFESMGACETGRHENWLRQLEDTGNTVCGRHPIGVMMAAVEELRRQTGVQGQGAFKFVRYERSSEVVRMADSSVSYASAFACV
jgi:AmmeMemoRadiSam system protein B